MARNMLDFVILVQFNVLKYTIIFYVIYDYNLLQKLVISYLE